MAVMKQNEDKAIKRMNDMFRLQSALDANKKIKEDLTRKKDKLTFMKEQALQEKRLQVKAQKELTRERIKQAKDRMIEMHQKMKEHEKNKQNNHKLYQVQE